MIKREVTQMTTVYCRRNKDNNLDFYIKEKQKEYFLFSQKPYRGLEAFFKKGVSLDIAINHGKGKGDSRMHKVMSKLPAYIRYIEKEYEIAFFEQSKRRLYKTA